MFTQVFVFLFCLMANPAVIDVIQTDDCTVTLMQTDNGDHFLIKQVINEDPDEQLLLVMDTLGCTIAEEAGIPTNQVRIIPASIEFPTKRSGFPATFHTLAPGISTEEAPEWYDLDVHQRYRTENSKMWDLWGPLKLEDAGLRPTVIKYMALNDDLSKIVALDTFTNNSDRSAPNLFYDKKTNHFCGIDMAACYSSSKLGQVACRQITELLETNKNLYRTEKNALKVYKDTLVKLLQMFPPERLKNLLDQFVEESEIPKTQEVLDRLQYHVEEMHSNYESCERLVELLNVLEEKNL